MRRIGSGQAGAPSITTFPSDPAPEVAESGGVWSVLSEGGERLWTVRDSQKRPQFRFGAGLVPDQNLVLVSARSSSTGDYTLYAIDTESGRVVWESGGLGQIATPIVNNPNQPRIVYLGSRTANTLFAINARVPSTEYWRISSSSGFKGDITLADGGVFVGGNDGNVYARTADFSGNQYWNFDNFTADAGVNTSIVADGGDLYFGTDNGSVYSITVSGGNQNWQKNPDSSITDVATLGSEVFSYRRSTIHVHDKETGNFQRSIQIPTGTGGAFNLIEDGSALYTRDFDGVLVAIDPSDGSELWRYTPAGGDGSSLTLSGGVIYGRTNANTIFAVDTSTGSALWERQYTDTFGSTPLVSEDTVYAGAGRFGYSALSIEPGGDVIEQYVSNGTEWAQRR